MPAELWGLIEELKLVIELNVTHLHVEMYVQIVVESITKNIFDNFVLKHLLNKCMTLMERIPHRIIRHIYEKQIGALIS